ncbi:dnaJ homolog subfamily C member 24-like [Lutzomyia longipalpis]|uniref:dnaJ homolog subfamily C member 24-like n=1 Tax=Lutzomyia longipalpis TaxID=7200 RepID=UPI00248398B2|nr:dnaJ homolog subfamily C member 24-like [Lutzomyia longipalpis]
MSPNRRNYYEILGCSAEATLEELKKSYQTLILKHHPDKMPQITEDEVEKQSESFHMIDTAYKVLRDPESRKIYDAELLQEEFCMQPLVFATVDRKEFIWDTESELMCKTCRCGGTYILPEDEEMPENENIFVACDECSLVIEVLMKK